MKSNKINDIKYHNGGNNARKDENSIKFVSDSSSFFFPCIFPRMHGAEKI
jgi:hypothetical protein